MRFSVFLLVFLLSFTTVSATLTLESSILLSLDGQDAPFLVESSVPTTCPGLQAITTYTFSGVVSSDATQVVITCGGQTYQFPVFVVYQPESLLLPGVVHNISNVTTQNFTVFISTPSATLYDGAVSLGTVEGAWQKRVLPVNNRQSVTLRLTNSFGSEEFTIPITSLLPPIITAINTTGNTPVSGNITVNQTNSSLANTTTTTTSILTTPTTTSNTSSTTNPSGTTSSSSSGSSSSGSSSGGTTIYVSNPSGTTSPPVTVPTTPTQENTQQNTQPQQAQEPIIVQQLPATPQVVDAPLQETVITEDSVGDTLDEELQTPVYVFVLAALLVLFALGIFLFHKYRLHILGTTTGVVEDQAVTYRDQMRAAGYADAGIRYQLEQSNYPKDLLDKLFPETPQQYVRKN